ncbi:MAG: hypothetical protein M3R00_04835 [Pseudomonadota bacterium]|nr:hypothetical protein [Pseudomonadota bacterium]
MFFIGLAVGAVIGGVGWVMDYNARHERYAKEIHEQEERSKSKACEKQKLVNDRAVFEDQMKKQGNVLSELKSECKEFKKGRDHYKFKYSEKKEQKVDLEARKNDLVMKDDFAEMGF